MLTLLTNLPKDVLISQIKDGGILIILGMGTVFLFLTILIFTTKAMSRIVRKMQPAKPAQPAAKTNAAPQTVQTRTDDAAIAAAIAAAVDHER